MATPTFDTIEAQASCGAGLQVRQQLSESGLQGLLPEVLAAGIADALGDDQPQVPVEAIHHALREAHEHADTVRREHFQVIATDGQKYLDESREKEGVNSTEPGLQFRVLAQGESPILTRIGRVCMHYTGKSIGSTIFDSSVACGKPAEFPVTSVTNGQIKALILVLVGPKWGLTISHNLAYGEHGADAPIPPFNAPIFEAKPLSII